MQSVIAKNDSNRARVTRFLGSIANVLLIRQWVRSKVKRVTNWFYIVH